MVRLGEVDVKGSKPVYIAMQAVKGVKYSMANAICTLLNLDKTTPIGDVPNNTLEKIKEMIKEPKKFNVPSWMLNRQKDYETGEDLHLSSSDLKFNIDNDIKRLKKIKSYKGMRHAWGLPVRGQRTKAHFRKGRALGVARAKKRKSGK